MTVRQFNNYNSISSCHSLPINPSAISGDRIGREPLSAMHQGRTNSMDGVRQEQRSQVKDHKSRERTPTRAAGLSATDWKLPITLPPLNVPNPPMHIHALSTSHDPRFQWQSTVPNPALAGSTKGKTILDHTAPQPHSQSPPWELPRNSGPVSLRDQDRQMSMGSPPNLPKHNPNVSCQTNSHSPCTVLLPQPNVAASQTHRESEASVVVSEQPYNEASEPRIIAVGHPVMRLETVQGPIHIPVDVKSASKVAGEKRKRNATASHRFRQLRKKKDRETSEQIHRLVEERDYYRDAVAYYLRVAESGQADCEQFRLQRMALCERANIKAKTNTAIMEEMVRPPIDATDLQQRLVPPTNAGPLKLPESNPLPFTSSENAHRLSIPDNTAAILYPPDSRGGPFNLPALPIPIEDVGLQNTAKQALRFNT